MTVPTIDIIVPVWNRPVETRACLVSLTTCSPCARLILVNNGCDRETENLLEEFAEALDERALLISNAINEGPVRAINKGLARVEAAIAVIFRSTSLATEGWLEPLLMLVQSRPEVGIVVPRLVAALPSRKQAPCSLSLETDRGDFAAMLITGGLRQRIGGLDEHLDGGVWCLRDFSRRARKAGYLTCIAEGSPVVSRDEPLLGSVARREENVARSAAVYAARWGTPHAYCVYFPLEATLEAVREKFEAILLGARQGHAFTVLLSAVLYRELLRNGFGALHTGIQLEKLPRWRSAGRAGAIADALRARQPEVVNVSGIDGIPFPDGRESISFSELQRCLAVTEAEKYGLSP